jgi:hypothetical protein
MLELDADEVLFPGVNLIGLEVIDVINSIEEDTVGDREQD